MSPLDDETLRIYARGVARWKRWVCAVVRHRWTIRVGGYHWCGRCGRRGVPFKRPER